MRLLLAEDEKELSDALTAILRHNHYSVDAVYNGQDALDWALSQNYDAVILDIMMPKKSGLEVLKEMRARGVDTPVLMLTAKAEVEDRIAGLDMGADDYLPKPFAMGELLARIRAATRRKGEFAPNQLIFGNVCLDRATFELTAAVPHSETGGEKSGFRLGNKEFQILEMLMANPNRLISTEQFMERIWGFDSEADISVVWVYLSNIRKKLATIDPHVTIRASRGAGYMLEENYD